MAQPRRAGPQPAPAAAPRRHRDDGPRGHPAPGPVPRRPSRVGSTRPTGRGSTSTASATRCSARITVLGRDDTADIILDDPGISRRHSEIRVTNDGPHLVTSIRDLGSTNGTFVNSERITSQRLEDGDRLTVGRTSVDLPRRAAVTPHA